MTNHTVLTVGICGSIHIAFSTKTTRERGRAAVDELPPQPYNFWRFDDMYEPPYDVCVDLDELHVVFLMLHDIVLI